MTADRAGVDGTESADGAEDAEDAGDGDGAPRTDRTVPNRKGAALATLPFLALGLIVVLLSLEFAPQPLWAFLLLPPVVFMSVLTYLTFRSGFLSER